MILNFKEWEKMKRGLKSLFGLILVAVLMCNITGCGEVKKAETVVNGMFASFKVLDFDKAKEYVNVEDILSTETTETSSINGDIFMKTLFDRLGYKIISSEKIDNETVIVKTEITAIDMKPVLGEWFGAALQFAFENAFEKISEEESNNRMEELFVEAATKEDLATVTNTVDIKVVKVDNNWKVETDDKFIDSILGGLISASEELSNTFNTQDNP